MWKYFKKNLFYSFIILISLAITTSAAVYRIYALNKSGIAISLILAAIIFIILQTLLKSKSDEPIFDYKLNNKENNFKTATKSTINYILPTVYILFLAGLFYILYLYRTNEAIISPWQVLPSYFFLLYGLATLLLFLIILKKSGNKSSQLIKIILISLHYFLSFSVAWLVYKIGYGYDPFIHQATVDLIAKTGSVEPKPFYYLGQYGLTVILHKITAIPIVWIDKLLVPVLATITIPASFSIFLNKQFNNKKINLLLIIALLIFPFSFFIVTTPQNLAYIFLLLAILFGLICSNWAELLIVYLFSLTTLLIHPLAGIPAVLFSLALTIYHSDKNKIKKFLYPAVFILSSIALPLVFYFIEIKNNLDIQNQTITAEQTNHIFANFLMPDQENFILNFIYLYGFNIKLLIALMALAGLGIAARHRKKCKIFFVCLLMALAIGISYLLTKKLTFSYLIDYERDIFSDRILTVAAIFLIPFILITIYCLVNKLLQQPKFIKTPLFLFLAILVATSLYISYPRLDNYYNSHGYSVSQNDIEAVNWIKADAGDNYIVLANQQTSAAALREFGFNHYVTLKNNSKTYFYPIPTSSQLYPYYLDMVYKKPSRDTMLAAMDFTGAEIGYFILNKYWWAFTKILAEAKIEADSWKNINNGEIYIFKYSK